MKERLSEFLVEYRVALAGYLLGEGEGPLHRAYELGRSALASGLGTLQLTEIHRQAMLKVLPGLDDPQRAMMEAVQFFAECLSPFEMAYRGYREANEALQTSEKRYRELFENANDVVFTMDLNGQFTSVNRAGEELSGYRRDEVLGMNYEAFIASESLPLTRRMLADAVAGEVERTRYEVDLVARDGRRIPVEVHAALIHENGQPVGIHGIARDITERKQAEVALRRLNERLEEEARRIAHALHDEAGQLLGSVHLALDEYAQGVSPEARTRLRAVKELLGQIEDQLRHLSHELRPTILDDFGLLPALEFLAQRVAKRSGLAILVQGSTEKLVPPSTATALYRSVQEALMNVVRHARATSVTIDVRSENGSVHCSVSDDGVGFDMSELVSRRGDRGLGLIGIRERASSLGGTVEIWSAPSRGTELAITIPLALFSE